VTGPKAKKETDAIRRMIDVRLQARLAIASPAAGEHLDEDAICAFVEGRLDETESSPVISHLIACSSCRRTTAQLARFESRFDPEAVSNLTDESPGRLSPFLDRLAARLAPALEEDAVFAYQEPAAELDQDAEKSDDRD
jgi:hypothetical protein